MNDAPTTALVDQLDAAAGDAERRAAALAGALPGVRQFGVPVVGSWAAGRLAELKRRQLAVEPELCAHLRRSVQPAVVFLSQPERMSCVPCAQSQAPRPDHPCDRCGLEGGPVNVFAAQAGAVVVLFGLCAVCASSPLD